jgi:4-amino-4-deoxychorismate lyase
MCRFIETIRAEGGVIQQPDRHQQRMSRTLREHGISAVPSIYELLKAIDIHPNGRVRVRIEYGLDGMVSIEQFPYMRKTISSMRLMSIQPPDYQYKYADRAWINALKDNSQSDEILIVRDHSITDASIANIAFFDGRTWWTPDTPLLHGTERERLLESGIIRETRVRDRDLGSYLRFRLINAMLPWEDEITYDMSVIT